MEIMISALENLLERENANRNMEMLNILVRMHDINAKIERENISRLILDISRIERCVRRRAWLSFLSRGEKIDTKRLFNILGYWSGCRTRTRLAVRKIRKYSVKNEKLGGLLKEYRVDVGELESEEEEDERDEVDAETNSFC